MKSSTIFTIIIVVLVAARIILSMNMPIWIIAAANQDDFWMVFEADLRRHFSTHYNLSLVKPMSYPIFLQAINLLHIPYRLAIGVLWVIAAGLVTLFFRCLTKNKIALVLVFAFVLYCPAAFDDHIGGRLYRNVVIAPAVFIVIALLLLLTWQIIFKREHFKLAFITSILLGAAFLFFYYIKEDSIWLLPMFVVFTAVAFISVFVRKQKGDSQHETVKYLALVLIPVVLFIGGTNFYKMINDRYFGVYEINTRTESEFAEFSARLFRIEDENKTASLWLPFSTFEKAWAVSPTLQQYPQVLESLKHSPWASGNLVEIALPGDFPLWALRDAMGESALYATEKTALDILSAATSEIDAAFQNGSLNREEGKIYLSKASNGRSFDEIFALSPMVRFGWKADALYTEYRVATAPYENDLANPELAGRQDYAANFIHDEFATTKTFENTNTKYALSISNVILNVYRVLAFALIPISIIGFVLILVDFVRKKILSEEKSKYMYILLSMVMLAFSATALIFGVAWFSEWLGPGAMTVYAVAAVPAIQLFESLGVYVLLRMVRKSLSRRNHRYLNG